MVRGRAASLLGDRCSERQVAMMEVRIIDVALDDMPLIERLLGAVPDAPPGAA